MGGNVPLRSPGYGDCARQCAFSQSLSLILLSKSDSNFILFREKKKNRKLQSVTGIIKQQIHHLLGEAETRGPSWQ